jgi:hypothetical protein
MDVGNASFAAPCKVKLMMLWIHTIIAVLVKSLNMMATMTWIMKFMMTWIMKFMMTWSVKLRMMRVWIQRVTAPKTRMVTTMRTQMVTATRTRRVAALKTPIAVAFPDLTGCDVHGPARLLSRGYSSAS